MEVHRHKLLIGWRQAKVRLALAEYYNNRTLYYGTPIPGICSWVRIYSTFSRKHKVQSCTKLSGTSPARAPFAVAPICSTKISFDPSARLRYTLLFCFKFREEDGALQYIVIGCVCKFNAIATQWRCWRCYALFVYIYLGTSLTWILKSVGRGYGMIMPAHKKGIKLASKPTQHAKFLT